MDRNISKREKFKERDSSFKDDKKTLNYIKRKNKSNMESFIDSKSKIGKLSFKRAKSALIRETFDYFRRDYSLPSSEDLSETIKIKFEEYITNTDLRMNFTKKQLQKLKKYVSAVYLFTRDPPYTRNKISDLTGLHNQTVSNLMKDTGIAPRIPKGRYSKSSERKHIDLCNDLFSCAECLKRLIRKYDLTSRLFLQEKAAPSKNELENLGLAKLYYHIEHNSDFTVNRVIEAAGLIPSNVIKNKDKIPLEAFCKFAYSFVRNKKSPELGPDEMLKNMSFKFLLEKSKIPTRKNLVKKAKRLFTILVNVLNSHDYDELIIKLKEREAFGIKSVKDSDRKIRRIINRILPTIGLVTGLDISKFLPREKKDYIFNDFKKIVEEYFILISPSNEIEFENYKKKYGGASKIMVMVHCGNPMHPSYEIRFDTILYGASCKYHSGYTIPFQEIKDLVEYIGLRNSGQPGLLLKPKDLSEFKKMIDLSEKSITPAIMPIIVSCGKHPSFETQYHYLQQGNWCPICSNRISSIGNYIHYILETITFKTFKKKGCLCIHEYNIFPNRNVTVDFIVIRDKGFDLRFGNKIPEISKQIRYVVFDYTISSKYKILKQKCLRGYQSSERLLIVVCLSDKKKMREYLNNSLLKINNIKNVPHKSNIIFMTFNEYITLFNFDKENILKLKKMNRLRKYSFRNDDKIRELEELSKFHKSHLPKRREKKKIVEEIRNYY